VSEGDLRVYMMQHEQNYKGKTLRHERGNLGVEVGGQKVNASAEGT